jgi:hypothetical protein
MEIEHPWYSDDESENRNSDFTGMQDLAWEDIF